MPTATSQVTYLTGAREKQGTESNEQAISCTEAEANKHLKKPQVNNFGHQSLRSAIPTEVVWAWPANTLTQRIKRRLRLSRRHMLFGTWVGFWVWPQAGVHPSVYRVWGSALVFWAGTNYWANKTNGICQDVSRLTHLGHFHSNCELMAFIGELIALIG